MSEDDMILNLVSKAWNEKITLKQINVLWKRKIEKINFWDRVREMRDSREQLREKQRRKPVLGALDWKP